MRDAMLRGMTAGLVGAGVMSLVRLVAHRAGLIDRLIPQVLQERMTGAAGVEPVGGSAGHQLAAEIVHHGVAVAAGLAFGALAGRQAGVTAGLAFGLSIWAVDALGLLPALRVQRVGGGAVDVAAHAVFGAVLGLASRELGAQAPLRAEPARGTVARRVG